MTKKLKHRKTPLPAKTSMPESYASALCQRNQRSHEPKTTADAPVSRDEEQKEIAEPASKPLLTKKEISKIRKEEQLQQLELQNEERAKTWTAAIAKEKRIVYVMLNFVLAELVRVNKQFDLKTLEPQEVGRLKRLCSQAYYKLFPVVSRVMIQGFLKQRGRLATIRYWDASKGLFFVMLDSKKNVGLDTKKKVNRDKKSHHFLSPGNLEPITTKEESTRKSEGQHADPVFVAKATLLKRSLKLKMCLYQSEMFELVEAAEQEDLNVVSARLVKFRMYLSKGPTKNNFKRQEDEEDLICPPRVDNDGGYHDDDDCYYDDDDCYYSDDAFNCRYDDEHCYYERDEKWDCHNNDLLAIRRKVAKKRRQREFEQKDSTVATVAPYGHIGHHQIQQSRRGAPRDESYMTLWDM